MGRHLAVGANSFAQSSIQGFRANEFAPTIPVVIRIEAANSVGANLFAFLPPKIQANFEELGM